jgi:hypothetical protein
VVGRARFAAANHREPLIMRHHKSINRRWALLAAEVRDDWDRSERSAEHREHKALSIPASECYASATCDTPGHPRIILRKKNVFDLAKAESSFRCEICHKPDPWCRSQAEMARRAERGPRT